MQAAMGSSNDKAGEGLVCLVSRPDHPGGPYGGISDTDGYSTRLEVPEGPTTL